MCLRKIIFNRAEIDRSAKQVKFIIDLMNFNLRQINERNITFNALIQGVENASAR